VLAKFMLLRSVTEFFQRKTVLAFTLPYFLISLIVFVLYGVLTVRLTRFNLGDYQLLVSIQRWVFIGFTEIMYMLIFFTSLFLSDKVVGYQKRYIRLFGSWYLLYMILSCVSFFLIPKHEIVPFIFIFIFLSWHLIPILFLNLYLEKFQGQTAFQQADFETNLNLFAEKFEISKREQEVIQLISKGMSNQEISDALFISLQTVKDHIHHIFVKTGVKNRVQLTNLIRSG
jgi:DNA-binding CsgD family transcriptional regulator